jgi:hypothetical protein
MPERQWPERTLDMPPQDPWAEPPTTDMPTRHDATRPFQGGTSVFPGAAQNTAPVSGGAPGRPMSGAPVPGQPSSGGPVPGRPTSGGPVPGRPTSGGPVPGQPASAPPSPFTSGRASVTPRPQQQAAEHEPTGTGWPGAEQERPRRPLEWHLRQLRRGGEWSFSGLLFAFVSWGIWAISTGGDMTTPIITFVVSVIVAAGVFALGRLIGRVIWERQLGRERTTARGSHIVAGLFLVGVGIAFLQQVEWVMTAVRWVTGLFS